MPSRRLALAAPALLLTGVSAARAQGAWPSARPIEIFVGFSAGGGVDVMARAVAPFLSNRIPGARFVIVNRPGAAGQLGHEAAAQAAPTGYALGATSMPGLVSHPVERAVRYRVEELTYLANLVDDPCGVFVRADSPLRGLGDLVTAARAAPERLTYGVTGIGSDDHLNMFRLEAAADIRLTHVGFPGVGQMVPQVLNGSVDVAAFNVSEALPFVRDGRLRGLGQAAAERWPLMPGVPTYREQGLDVTGSAARGFIAPPGLPAPITEQLLTAFTQITADPAWHAEAERLGMPLRPVLGDAFRAQALSMMEELRVMWAERPWA